MRNLHQFTLGLNKNRCHFISICVPFLQNYFQARHETISKKAAGAQQHVTSEVKEGIEGILSNKNFQEILHQVQKKYVSHYED